MTQMSEEEKNHFEQMQQISNLQYPNTNNQFGVVSQQPQPNQLEWEKMSEEEQKNYYQQYYSQYYSQYYTQMYMQQQNQLPPSNLPPNQSENNNQDQPKSTPQENNNENQNGDNKVDDKSITEKKVPEEKVYVVNPFTKQEHELEDVSNPFSHETHPYSYKDFGWNRPQKKKRNPFGPKKTVPDKKDEVEDKNENNPAKRWKFDPNENYGPSMHNKGNQKKNDFASQNNQPLDF